MDDVNKGQETNKKMEQIREKRRIKNKEKRLKKQRNRKLQLLEDDQSVRNLGGNLHLVTQSNRDIHVSPTSHADITLDLSNPYQYPAIQDASVNKQHTDRPDEDFVQAYSDVPEHESFIPNATYYPIPQDGIEYHGSKKNEEKEHIIQNFPCGPSKVKSNTSFTRNINELIVSNEPQNIQNKPSGSTEVQIYKGNPLDADKPERFTGKFKAAPEVKKVSAIKRGILIDNEIRNASGWDKDVINYIPYKLTSELEATVLDFLKELVKLQRNMFAKNKAKAQMKKRYVLGFAQCTKYILGNNVKLLIIAVDHKMTREEDTLLAEINKIRNISNERDVEIIYAFTKRRLGSITKTFSLISCLAILNVDGIHARSAKYDKLHGIFKDYNVIKEASKT